MSFEASHKKWKYRFVCSPLQPAVELFNKWNVEVNTDLAEIEGRRFKPEVLTGGQGRQIAQREPDKADWSRDIKNIPVGLGRSLSYEN